MGKLRGRWSLSAFSDLLQQSAQGERVLFVTRCMHDLDLLLLLLFFAFSLGTIHPRGLDAGVVELHRALDVWAQNSKLTFREVNDDRAAILVFFEK